MRAALQAHLAGARIPIQIDVGFGDVVTPAATYLEFSTLLEGMGQRLEKWGIARGGRQLIDGSGLWRRDVVTPETLVAVLRRMHDPSGMSPWMTALPIAGRDGTLDGRMKGTAAENNVRAKTGAMSNIRAVAG